jgi:hypothetical protein
MAKLKIEFNEVLGENHIRVVLEEGARRHSYDVPKEKADSLHLRLMYTNNFNIAESFVRAAGGVCHIEGIIKNI